MIGHFVLFLAALVTAATAALGFPSSTASEGCATPVVLTQSAVQRSVDAQSISDTVRSATPSHPKWTISKESC